jgi:SMC interacting uncharacterized protein involved in chromosome segregation
MSRLQSQITSKENEVDTLQRNIDSLNFDRQNEMKSLENHLSKTE